MFIVIVSFGSPFAGHVCDDGEVTRTEHETLEGAKAFLKHYADKCQAPSRLSADGLCATFMNVNGSDTGYGLVYEQAQGGQEPTGQAPQLPTKQQERTRT